MNSPKNAGIFSFTGPEDRVRYSSVSACDRHSGRDRISGLLHSTPGRRPAPANCPPEKPCDHFTKTDFTGLFQFLRHIDGLIRRTSISGSQYWMKRGCRAYHDHTQEQGAEFPVCIAGTVPQVSFRRNESSGLTLLTETGASDQELPTDSRVHHNTRRKKSRQDLPILWARTRSLCRLTRQRKTDHGRTRKGFINRELHSARQVSVCRR